MHPADVADAERSDRVDGPVSSVPRRLADQLPRLRPLALPVVGYVLSRIVAVGAALVASMPEGSPSPSEMFTSWDSGWYMNAAESGYPAEVGGGPSTHAFFPLLPLSIRALTGIGFGALEGGLIAATLFGLGATIVVWLYVRDIRDTETADRAAFMFAFFPGAFVLSLVYSEGLMLAFAAGCLWALHRERWAAAGVLAALAGLTRPNAVVLVAACAWAAFVAIRRYRDWRPLIAPLIAPLGFAGFMIFLWARTGQLDAWLIAQRAGWEENFDFGVQSSRLFWNFVINPLGTGRAGAVDANDTYIQAVGLGVVFVVIGLVLMYHYWKPRGEVWIYTLGIVALAVGSETLGLRPRFVFTAFPLIVAVAIAVSRRWTVPVVATSAAVMVFLMQLTMTTLRLTP